MTGTLASRAMLTTLRISQWSARRLDRKVTNEVNASHNAAADAGRYNKLLIAKGALADVQRIVNAARDFHYSRTSPWGDDGPRILSAKVYLAYTAGIAAKRQEFESAVTAFVASYPAVKADAQIRLNGLFDPADYPADSDIAGRFSFSAEILPLPMAGDFRVELAEGQAEDIRSSIEARSAEVLQGTMRDAWSRIATHVGRMAEKLAAYKPAGENIRNSEAHDASGRVTKAEGIFRDSLVDNVRELAGILPALNLTDDPALSAMTARIEERLCSLDAGVLRELTSARLGVAADAAAILKDVGAYLS